MKKNLFNLFNSAVVKLTLIYTIIITIVCAGFSVAFYTAADRELSRPISLRVESTNQQNTTPLPSESEDNSFRIILEQRNNQIRTNLLALLITIDVSVLIVSACVSFFFARWTLKPIQKMTEQQTNFISDASHELRTPLTAMTMENEVALRDPKTTKAELSQLVRSNLEEAQKLQDLTNRLLRLSQQEPLDLSTTDLSKSVQTAADNLSTIANRKKISIKNQVKSYKTLSNPEALTDILSILIENAIKYSHKNSTVTISFKDNKIAVCDQGVGISEADLPHIFERFFRAEKSRTSKGYGLGLALAKQLAEQLHLKISVQNNSSVGTTFFIGNFSKLSA